MIRQSMVEQTTCGSGDDRVLSEGASDCDGTERAAGFGILGEEGRPFGFRHDTSFSSLRAQRIAKSGADQPWNKRPVSISSFEMGRMVDALDEYVFDHGISAKTLRGILPFSEVNIPKGMAKALDEAIGKGDGPLCYSLYARLVLIHHICQCGRSVSLETPDGTWHLLPFHFGLGDIKRFCKAWYQKPMRPQRPRKRKALYSTEYQTN